MVVLRSISLVITPPRVSIPNERGVTSSNNTSDTWPAKIPPWIAAPIATTSSGFTDLFGSLPKNSFTLGIRVDPPTKITSSIWLGLNFASESAFLHGSSKRLNTSEHSDSSFAREIFIFKCLGPDASAVIYGRLISVSCKVESSFFAFSAASFKRWSAMLSLRKSRPFSLWNSCAR